VPPSTAERRSRKFFVIDHSPPCLNTEDRLSYPGRVCSAVSTLPVSHSFSLGIFHSSRVTVFAVPSGCEIISIRLAIDAITLLSSFLMIQKSSQLVTELFPYRMYTPIFIRGSHTRPD
jgi:hypothetical protein